MEAPLQMVEPVGSGYGGRRGSRSGSKTSLEKKTPERSSEPGDDSEENNQWMPDRDPRDERGEFSSRAQFLLTVIGYTIGNGNIWYFSHMVRNNGGGTFLIIYCLCMAIFGVPMLYLEMMIGQIAQVGPMRAFQLNFPLLQGVGWVICSLSFLRSINYSLLNAISLEYAVESLIGIASRAVCTNEWNTAECFSHKSNRKYCNETTVWFNKTCITLEERLKIPPMIEQPAIEFFRVTIRGVPASFTEGIAQGSEQEYKFGSLRVVVCFCIVWFFAAFCLLRKVQWLGKLSQFIVISTGIITLIFNLFAVTFLERSDVGIAKFFHIEWEKFADIEVWRSALRFTRSCLCLGMGGMVSLSSYNKRSNDSFWDSVIVVAAVTIFNFASGISTYIILANNRHKFPFLNWKRQEKHMTSFFIYFAYYPDVIENFRFAVFWSFIFYTMLLGLCTSAFFGLLETPISALTDQFKWCRKHRSLAILTLICVGFAAGLVQCTQIGWHIFYILDARIILRLSLILFAFELLVVLFYGPRNFYRDINASIGKKVNFFEYFLSPYGLIIRICQFAIGPFLLAFTISDIPTYANIVKDIHKRMEIVLGNNKVQDAFVYFSFFPYPLILAGLIAALVKHVKAGKPWFDLFRPDPMHPAIRYKVPPPLGCIFGLKPIEAMPSAMGDEKVIDFPDKKEPPKIEEEVLEIGRA